MPRFIYIVFLCFFLTCANVVMAQRTGRVVGIGPSLSAYKGDLSGYRKFSSALELTMRRLSHKRIRSSFSFVAGRVVAQATGNIYEGQEYNPYEFIQTQFLGLSAGLNYYVLNKDRISIFAGLGFGVFQFEPQDQYGNDIHIVTGNARPEGEKYELTKIMWPIEIGLLYRFKDNLYWNLNLKTLNVRTDYLDNISRLANSNNKDNILLINIGVMVYFGDPGSDEIQHAPDQYVPGGNPRYPTRGYDPREDKDD